MTDGRDSSETGKWGRLKLGFGRIRHFWQYFPEVRHWFWKRRIRRQVEADRRAGRKPLLFVLTVYGHRQFIRPVMDMLRSGTYAGKYSLYLALDQKDDLPEGDLLGVERWKIRPYPDYLGVSSEFDALLAADIAERFPPAETPVRIWSGHGLPSKWLSASEDWISKYTHYFVSGALDERFINAVLEQSPHLREHFRTEQVGYPKSDILLGMKGQRDEILRGLGLDPKLPTILYAPAFNEGTSLPRYGEELIRTLAGIVGVNILVKLHPVSYDRSVIGVHSNGQYWPDILKKYEGERFVHAGNVEVMPCLEGADLLLTDVSGVAMEYLLLDRPVVYLESPDFFRGIGVANDGGGNLLVNVGRPAGGEVGYLRDLERVLKEELANPRRRSEARQGIARQLIYNSGHATEVAVRVLEGILEGNKTD